jgi:hypothetical protein
MTVTDPWEDAPIKGYPVVQNVDVNAVQKVLDRLTYKDGWTFHCRVYTGSDGHREPYIEARHTEPDSRNRENVIEGFARRWPMGWPYHPYSNSPHVIVAWVRHALHEWEVHESNEWLRLDGERVHDPHICEQCRIGGCRA